MKNDDSKHSKDSIVDEYCDLYSELGRTPKARELKDKTGISKDMVAHHVGSMSILDQEARAKHPDIFTDVDIEDIYSKKALQKLRKAVKANKRFIITTAVTGGELDENFFKSCKHYEKTMKALLLILISSDNKKSKGYGSIDKRLINEFIVLEDTELNSNLLINTVRTTAKHIDPTSGLDRIGQRDGSFIFSSPKQRLNMVATSNTKLPHALMTTGAITKPNYCPDPYMKDRMSFVADRDHVMGGLIVEVENDDVYHYRQIQADENGSFIDLGVRYSDGKTSKVAPEAIIPGDWHSGETDPIVDDCITEITKLLKPKYMIWHDAFNGLCVNHHEDDNKLLRGVRAMNGQMSLEQEIRGLVSDMNRYTPLVEQLIVVKSNHDEFLSKHYLAHGKYVEDPQNHYLALKLALAQMEGKDALQYGAEMYGLHDKNKVRWLQRDEDFKIAGIQCGAHGDKGPNGSIGSLRTMEKSYGQSVTGHSHTPGILRGAWAMGTSSKMRLTYNEGPSSWLQTLCLVYPNGSRQLINIINGKWRMT